MSRFKGKISALDAELRKLEAWQDERTRGASGKAASRSRYAVKLSAVANPDIAGGFYGSKPKSETVGVSTLVQAARTARDYIERHGLGGGNWSGGQVIDRATKVQVAYISYNGRIWGPPFTSSSPRTSVFGQSKEIGDE